MKSLFILVVPALLSACAAQVPLKKVTQSGKPEGVYHNVTKAQVRDALVNRCNNKGSTILSSDESSVVCAKTLDGSSAFMTQLLIGNSYSTPPQGKIRFSIAQLQSDVKVWADMWVETQMPGGQVNTMPAEDNATKNNIQAGLDDLKIEGVK
ncbi:TPA: hypothetical protein LU109_003626 [Enterobacter hormaechei subsp. xiangfangensis]|nr:hypothetical protein [Enterobacter hormaechei subsp. xiangfangensis]